MKRMVCWLERLSMAFSWVSIGIIGLLAFPMIYDVVLRSFGHPTIWAFELTTYALIAGTFLGNAHALRDGKHFRVTFLIKTFPRARGFLNYFSVALTLLFGLLLVVAGGIFVEHAFVTHLRSPTLLNVPLYLPELAIPLGGVSLMTQALVNLLTGQFPELSDLAVSE